MCVYRKCLVYYVRVVCVCLPGSIHIINWMQPRNPVLSSKSFYTTWCSRGVLRDQSYLVRPSLPLQVRGYEKASESRTRPPKTGRGRERKREEEMADKVDGCTWGDRRRTLRLFRVVFIGPTQGLPKRRWLRRYETLRIPRVWF